jgi:hypothetical protein
MSLGDIFIRIGAGIILYYAIKKSKDTINRINMLKIFYNLLSLDFIRISSYKIARFLFKYLKQYNKYTYAYTCKFLFSTLYDFILIVLCNYIFNLNCIIYIVMFSASILRIFTGGVHMNKLWKCTYIWLAMFITGSFIIKSLANININLNTYSIILSIIMGIFIQCFTLIPIGKQFLNYLSKKLDKIFNKQFFRKYF